MNEKEGLLLSAEEKNTCTQSFKTRSKSFQGFFDWMPLIVFYALQGSVSLTTNCLIPTLCGLISLSFSYLRCRVDSTVVFPKVLDVGFLAIFIIFTLICYTGGRSAQYLLQMWSNAIMNALLGICMFLGCVLNRPFVLPYALEAGMPAKFASAPSMLYKLNKSAMEWVYAVLMMTIVSTIAPSYLCVSSEEGCYGAQDNTYNSLNMIFTNAAQYVILGYMLYKTMYLEPKKRQETEIWTFRSSEEIRIAYGMPTTERGMVLRKVESLKDVNPLVKDKWGAPVNDKSIEAKLNRASHVAARAFLEDPMIRKWPQIGAYFPEKRLVACERIFWMILRAATPLNHTYFIDDCSYCVGIPCWERGDEHDMYFGPPAIRLLDWDQPLPPVELIIIREMTNAALQGRKHLHIALFYTDPSKEGKGYGSACMRTMLRVADMKGIVTSLETMTNKNRKIYEHYGFRVVGSLNVEGCTDPWYSMIRDVPNNFNNCDM